MTEIKVTQKIGKGITVLKDGEIIGQYANLGLAGGEIGFLHEELHLMKLVQTELVEALLRLKGYLEINLDSEEVIAADIALKKVGM